MRRAVGGPGPRVAGPGRPEPYDAPMATKSKPTGEAKKPGRTLKEKRAAKQEKLAAQKQTRKGWEGK